MPVWMGFQYERWSAAQSSADKTVFPTFVSVPVINRSLAEIIERLNQAANICHLQSRRKRQPQPGSARRDRWRTDRLYSESMIPQVLRSSECVLVRAENQG